MRIAIQTIIAVLFLAAILFPCTPLPSDQFLHGHKSRRLGNRREHRVSDRYLSFSRSNGYDFEESEGRPWPTHREHLMLLRQEGGEEGYAVECCPSVLEMVEPVGGKNLDGLYVELYSDGDKRQRFYERSCREDVFDQPCRFLDKKLFNQSRCVQKYSYTYALVRDVTFSCHDPTPPSSRHHHDSKGWRMDYIQVRSGCSCEILPKLKKKRNPKNKKTFRSRKFQFEKDET